MEIEAEADWSPEGDFKVTKTLKSTTFLLRSSGRNGELKVTHSLQSFRLKSLLHSLSFFIRMPYFRFSLFKMVFFSCW